jgi:hypothetical protein
MDLSQYLQGFSFRFVQPGARSAARALAPGLRRLGLPLDALNTRLPLDRDQMRRRLGRTGLGAAASPLAIRAIINRGVAHLGRDEAFVAYGVGDGDLLLAAIAGNSEKHCIGIRDHHLKEPRAVFQRRLAALANEDSHFIEEGFRECVARLGSRRIGMAFVSALTHESVARRLADCQLYLAENAYLLVDNANCARTRDAVLEFASAGPNQYRVLFEARTKQECSLTWGRGLIVMQLLGRNALVRHHSEPATSPVLVPAA